MKRVMYLLFMILITACASPTEIGVPIPSSTGIAASQPALEMSATLPASTEALASATFPVTDDVFTQMGITLPAPVCGSLTQPQTEGPYYSPNTPERNILFEEGMEGTKLILAGYVLDQDCNPVPNAWLDFWQADARGEYDNAGYRLRGHQYTDEQGRYYLETVLPGLYQSRPIEHIHVKVRPEGGEEITSQLYFPNQPVEGLTVQLEDRGDYTVGYFNFVVQR
jgi:protocatechuate 3,4-dioxygenase beta subunit